VQRMNFAPTAEPALTVSAETATIVPSVCYVNSARNTYVSAAEAVPSVS